MTGLQVKVDDLRAGSNRADLTDLQVKVD